jgi:hypothetical protein
VAINHSIKKYLSGYAEPESQDLGQITRHYKYVLVIPICNEQADCLQQIFSLIQEANVLIVAVLNSPIGNQQWQKTNALFVTGLMDKYTAKKQLSRDSTLLSFDGFNDVILVDKNNKIPKKLGVGLARKIGADIALQLYQQGNITWPWIFSTDADVVLPCDYFLVITKTQQQNSALVLDFNHVSEDTELIELQMAYDIKLRYYHAGIIYAGSSYDYIPLGSTLIINMLCYAQVRGFPKKNAGEDFYLLNKLAKIKPVSYHQDDCVIAISVRISDRVPFGTGPALAQIQALENPQQYTYYHPQCFIYLRQWLLYLNAMWADDRLNIKPPTDPKLLALYQQLNCQHVFKKSLAQITSATRWQQFVHQWFDAFKTLKSVHFFDGLYPRLTYRQLSNNESFAKVSNLKLDKLLNQYDKIKSRSNPPDN